MTFIKGPWGSFGQTCPPVEAINKDIEDVYRLVLNNPINLTDFAPYSVLYPNVPIENNGNESSWYYLKVNEFTMRKLRNNEMDLLSAFRSSDDGKVYKVIMDDNKPIEIQALNFTDLPVETLPDKGLFIGEVQKIPMDSSVHKI